MSNRWITGTLIALSIGVSGCNITPPSTTVRAEAVARPVYHTQSLLGDIVKTIKKGASTVVDTIGDVATHPTKVIDKGAGTLGKVIGKAVGTVAGKKAGEAVGKIIGRGGRIAAGELTGLGSLQKAIDAAKAIAAGKPEAAAGAIAGDKDMLAAAKAANALLKGDAEAAVDAVSTLSKQAQEAMKAAKVATAMADKETAEVLEGGKLDPALAKAVEAAKRAKAIAAGAEGVRTAESPDLAQAVAAAKAAEAVARGGAEAITSEVDVSTLAAAKVTDALTKGDVLGALTAAAKLDPKIAMALLTALAAREDLKTTGTAEAVPAAPPVATDQPAAAPTGDEPKPRRRRHHRHRVAPPASDPTTP